MTELILASNSPRRVRLLKKLKIPFTTVPSGFDEGKITESDPIKFAIAAAKGKALDVFNRYGGVCIGADTVVFAGKILGKPTSKEDAAQMLKLLSGKTHSVITGICIASEGKVIQDYAQTDVTFGDLSDIIKKYIESGSPFDKAGGYGIQDKLIKSRVISVSGSVDNVIGLPVPLIKKHLSQLQG